MNDPRAVREIIALAVRTHGRKRGWHVAASLLGTTERWVKSATYGESIAAPCAIRAERARLELARQRAAQLRAELADLERSLHGDTVEAGRGLRGVAR